MDRPFKLQVHPSALVAATSGLPTNRLKRNAPMLLDGGLQIDRNEDNTNRFAPSSVKPLIASA